MLTNRAYWPSTRLRGDASGILRRADCASAWLSAAAPFAPGGWLASLTLDERLLATLATAAPAGLPPVSAIGLETALEAMAPASKLALAADCDCWVAWCAGERRKALPADPEDLVRYLRALEADGKKSAPWPAGS